MMILDAAAGNCTMWRDKANVNIIYIDVEKRLERKPTLFADNTKTPFLDKTFSTIFYDPPHSWYRGKGAWFSTPGISARVQRLMGLKGYTYYGLERYKNKQQLIKHLYNAQKEFKRILKPGGLLWFKWCEYNISLRRVLPIFADWTELLRIYVASPTQTIGMHQTYWVCLSKKREREVQTRLS